MASRERMPLNARRANGVMSTTGPAAMAWYASMAVWYAINGAYQAIYVSFYHPVIEMSEMAISCHLRRRLMGDKRIGRHISGNQ